jgi:hypothetical protein
MVILKLILFGYAVYFILKTTARFLFPFLFANYQQKVNEQGRAQFKNRREGEITIEHKGTGKKAYDKNIGEYIDYEEIKD